jgi:hypothetical protein
LEEDLVPDIATVLSSSLVGTVIGAVLKTIWDRRAAKKAPKTQMRAEAYRDFILYVVENAEASESTRVDSALGTRSEFHKITARLLLFGESEAVKAAAQLAQHRTLATPEAMHAFAEAVREMRKSLLTGHDEWVLEHAKALARSRPWA